MGIWEPCSLKRGNLGFPGSLGPGVLSMAGGGLLVSHRDSLFFSDLDVARAGLLPVKCLEPWSPSDDWGPLVHSCWLIGCLEPPLCGTFLSLVHELTRLRAGSLTGHEVQRAGSPQRLRSTAQTQHSVSSELKRPPLLSSFSDDAEHRESRRKRL